MATTTQHDNWRSQWAAALSEELIDWGHWRAAHEVGDRLRRVLLAQWDVDDQMIAMGHAVLTVERVTKSKRIYRCRADFGYDGLTVVWHPDHRAWFLHTPNRLLERG